MRRLAVLTLLAILTACQSGQDPGVDTEGAGPAPLPRTDLTVVAKNTTFDVAKLAGPVKEELTITFRNEDRTGHNFRLFGGSAGNFKTEIKPGPTTETLRVTFHIPADYEYRCDVHPDKMQGILTIVGAADSDSD